MNEYNKTERVTEQTLVSLINSLTLNELNDNLDDIAKRWDITTDELEEVIRKTHIHTLDANDECTTMKHKEIKGLNMKAKLTFTITKDNPDFKYINDENKILEFEDTYTFDENYDIEDATRYIKHDMLLIAGGGYSTQHVNVIEWDIKKRD